MHHVDHKLIVIVPGMRFPRYTVRLVGYIQGEETNVPFSPRHLRWKFGPTNHRMDLGVSVHSLLVLVPCLQYYPRNGTTRWSVFLTLL
jgi:hypothetical protein